MEDYQQKAVGARRKVLEMVHKAQTSHIASNFSVIDIATVLYANLKPKDKVVWSKGWAAATLYYFLAEQGAIPKNDLERFATKDKSGNVEYLGLAETNVPGVLCNGGAVGHGSSIAAGIAYAKKLKGGAGTVYCIMSDGELNEGSIWESALFGGFHKLSNLVFIIDNNGWQAMGKTDDVLEFGNLAQRFEGFGFKASKADGHDYEAIYKSLEQANHPESNMPHCFIFDTVKGKGVSFMENHLLYHYKYIDDDTYQKALKELV